MNTGDILKHFKGNTYVVWGVGDWHDGTGEKIVAYQRLPNGKLSFRPLSMFDEVVPETHPEYPKDVPPGTVVRRFEKVDFRVIFLDQYQELAWRTAARDPNAYPEMLRKVEPPELREEIMKRWDLHTWTHGLTGEAGEFSDYLKKVDGHGHPPDSMKENKELGDVCWYTSSISKHRGFTLSDIATTNIKKLMARYPDGFKIERSMNRKNE